MNDALARRGARGAVSVVLGRALRLGVIVTVVIAIGGSAIGFGVSGVPGVASAIAGAALAALFMSLTAASILIAARITKGSMLDGRYFGIVGGTWLLKLVVFVVIAVWLRGQDWLNPAVFFVSALVGVIGMLVVDIVALQSAREPYVDVTLPGETDGQREKTPPNS